MPKDFAYLTKERDRWALRESELKEELSKLESEEKRLRGELEKMREQVTYYTGLTRDMKKEVAPAGMSSMMKSI